MDFSLEKGHEYTSLEHVRWRNDDMIFKAYAFEGKVYTRAHCELRRKEEMSAPFPV